MACTLGRASLPSPDFIRQEGGGRLRVGHSGYAFTGSEGLIMAQQVTGYPNPDEEVVPFTYDATLAGGVLDGFYFCDSTNVDWAKLAGGMFAWEAVLVPVPGRQCPTFEIDCLGSNRDTAHAITEWSWVGLPLAAQTRAEVFESRLTGYVTATITGADSSGSATLYAAPTGSKTALYADRFQSSQNPDYYYYGGAAIQVSVDGGTTWTTVTGRDLPFTYADHVATRVRLVHGLGSNAAIRFTLPDTSDVVTLSNYDFANAAYESKSFTATTAGSTATPIAFNSQYPVTVLRNDPVACSVRVWYDTGYIDYTLRRGSWVIEGRAVSMAANQSFGIYHATTKAGTGVTGGIDETTATADGNKYQLRSPSAITAETTKGGIYLTSAAQSFPFAMALDFFSGDNTTSPSTSGLYFACMEHTQDVVAR